MVSQACHQSDIPTMVNKRSNSNMKSSPPSSSSSSTSKGKRTKTSESSQPSSNESSIVDKKKSLRRQSGSGSDEDKSKSTEPKSDSSSPLDRLFETDNIVDVPLSTYVEPVSFDMHYQPQLGIDPATGQRYYLTMHGQQLVGVAIPGVSSSSSVLPSAFDNNFHSAQPSGIAIGSLNNVIVQPTSSTIRENLPQAGHHQQQFVTTAITSGNLTASSSSASIPHTISMGSIDDHAAVAPASNNYPVDPEDRYMEDDEQWIKEKCGHLEVGEQPCIAQLVRYLQSLPDNAINLRFVRNIMSEHFTTNYIKQLTANQRRTSVHAVLLSTVIRHVIFRRSVPDYRMLTREELISQYPSFSTYNAEEITYLRRFERALRCALHLVPGDRNKQLLLSVGAHLEGSHRMYVTGGAASRTTRMRTDIYKNLTNVEPIPRPRRRTQGGSGSCEGPSGGGSSDNGDK